MGRSLVLFVLPSIILRFCISCLKLTDIYCFAFNQVLPNSEPEFQFASLLAPSIGESAFSVLVIPFLQVFILNASKTTSFSQPTQSNT